MRILIASTMIPFVEGGGTFIVDWLDEELRRRGHDVETWRIPFWPHYPTMPEQMLGLRLFDVANAADRLIAIRTPSYLLKHPKKTVWFIHHHRGAYDLWHTPYRDIPDTPVGRSYRDAIVSADNVALREASKLFTNSAEVGRRLHQFNGLDAEVLYPPLRAPERYHEGAYGDYIFYPSRLVHHKRQHLLVAALHHTRTPVRVVLAGALETESYAQELRRAASDPAVADRVLLIDRWITEDEKIELTSETLGVAYIPLLEDSYGYPSLEAYAAARPVITTADAGGTLELIVDGQTGFVAEPTPEALAAAMDELYDDRAKAAAMGRAGKARVRDLGITWDRVVERLLS